MGWDLGGECEAGSGGGFAEEAEEVASVGGDRGVKRAPDRVGHVYAEVPADIDEDGADGAAADLFGQFLDRWEAGEEIFGCVGLGFGALGFCAWGGEAETGGVDLFGDADETLPQCFRHAEGTHDAGHDESEIARAEGAGDGVQDVGRRMVAEGVGEAPAKFDERVDDGEEAEGR